MAIINPDGTVKEGTAGMVVAMGEFNGYDDSDFYAIYFNGEEFVKVDYATTRAGCGKAWGTKIDASDELINAYYRIKKLRNEIRDSLNFAKRLRENIYNVSPGKTCKVVKGRKIPKGEVVVVEMIRKDYYGNFNAKTNYSDGVWTNINNLEVVVE